ncbi:MAG: hypothetical protein Q9169_005711 [Polycauliona sp. 2 TL-2023]
MPDLVHYKIRVLKPDGSSTMTKVSYEELQEYMSTRPVGSLEIGDEDGNRREDTITIQEVKIKSQTALDALFKAWAQLRCIIAQHESALSRRWSNKKPKQRKELLREAWPEMSLIHRPIFEILRNKDRGKQTTSMTDFSLRFPYMYVEDLSQKDLLIVMLDSRGRNSPATFTNADRESLGVGLRSKLLVPKYIRGYTMLLNGEHTHETYGRLVCWKQDRQAFIKCQMGIAPDPGMGLLLLEIQRDVLKFLVRCAGLLLHNVPMANLLNTSMATVSTLQILQTTQSRTPLRTSTTNHASFATHTLDEPYRAPNAFNFGRMQYLVQAKCREVEDHFLLAREDPGYFVDLLQEERVHVVESVSLRNGDTKSAPLPEEAWDEILRQVLTTAYQDVLIWECIASLLESLAFSYEEQKATMRLGQPFPEAYVKEFSRLKFMLASTIQDYLFHLPAYMCAVPTFKKQIVNAVTSSGEYKFKFLKKPGKPQICGHANVLQEIEKLITNDNDQKKRLSSRLIRVVSDIAVIAEIQRQMDLCTCSEHSSSAWSDEENAAWAKNRLVPILELLTVLGGGVGLGSLVMDLRIFDYPFHKPRTASSTAKLRSAENALDNLWNEVNQLFVRKTGKTLKSWEEGRINYRDIRRTPAWIEPRSSTEWDSQVPEDLDVALALATLEQRTESTIDQSQPLGARQKTKTRSSTAHDSAVDTPDSGANTIGASASVAIPRLTVKKKAFNTFAALFGKSTANTMPGELPWVDFKRAMVNIGFGAEKLQGSAWLFKPSDKLPSGSIIFHEPHPESKLPMQWARRIARRLNRNFGWTAETFVTE